jgi:rhamnose utilization protein RhaD (predicted bifunctional aldolase and dehydrogenase)/NAD(P)-dependent dehydrogenase (short-subunit alcohol dehydrogenase family)
MQNRYLDADASRLVRELGVSEPLALRTYTARLLGADGALVLHGGGNTSVKAKVATLLDGDVEVIHIKGSGSDLATIDPAGHPAVQLAPLLRLRALPSMSDEDMVRELRKNLLDPAAPTPSVETLLHAFLPARFIDHTHADAILAVCDQPDGERICREIFGDGLVWVPYVMPGFTLALRCAEAFEAHGKRGKRPEVIVLERHGIFTFGDTAKASYGQMIAAVARAEGYVAEFRRTLIHDARATPPAQVGEVTCALRGVLAKISGAPTERGPIVLCRSTEAITAFLARADADELVAVGCATPDHVLRTKPTALLLRLPSPAAEPLATTIEAAVLAYAARYDAYFAEMCADKSVTRTKLDPWPRVILVPGVGLLAVGETRAQAQIVADIYEHTIDIMDAAADVGRYRPVSRADLFDVEYWSLEQAKLKKSAPLPLAQCVALVTGAASGIGRATAAALASAGAHVVMVDVSGERLAEAAAALGKGRATRITSIIADVTSEHAVDAAFAHACSAFGGVDLVVSNAGTAPIGDLHTAEGDKHLRESLDLNLLSHNRVASAAVRVMRAQGRGGCLLFNISKAAFAPGPHFGPYAVAKSALLALMRQYAVDAAPFGIRANGINADRIRTALFGDGVAERRAEARGLTVEQYFKSNLLGREVTDTDVADAFVYLASARATTGCILTVDGGNAAAFPR